MCAYAAESLHRRWSIGEEHIDVIKLHRGCKQIDAAAFSDGVI